MSQIGSHPPKQHARRWKRTAFLTLLLLIGGAIVNVAVAWGRAATLGPLPTEWSRNYSPHARFDDGWAWTVDIAEVTGARSTWSFWWRPEEGNVLSRQYPHPEGLIERFERRAIMPRSEESRHLYSFGLPIRSMWYTWIRPDRSSPGIYEGAMVAGPRTLHRLPLRPLFPGFIINTLFYTLLLWFLFFAPFTARRMLRRRRGLCEKCAYPVGTSPVCTECGAAVTNRRRQVVTGDAAKTFNAQQLRCEISTGSP